jgi:hypothetical protein
VERPTRSGSRSGSQQTCPGIVPEITRLLADQNHEESRYFLSVRVPFELRELPFPPSRCPGMVPARGCVSMRPSATNDSSESVRLGGRARLLGVSEEAGAKRYMHVLKWLKDVPAKLPDGLEGLQRTVLCAVFQWPALGAQPRVPRET